jgi:hypothetical protein
MDLQEVGWRAWTGLIWHRIGTGGVRNQGYRNQLTQISNKQTKGKRN